MPRRPDPFDHDPQDSSAYRAQRLEEERELLERRQAWAIQRGDAKAVKRLMRRLDALEREIDVDLSPGCPASRFERWRW